MEVQVSSPSDSVILETILGVTDRKKFQIEKSSRCWFLESRDKTVNATKGKKLFGVIPLTKTITKWTHRVHFAGTLDSNGQKATLRVYYGHHVTKEDAEKLLTDVNAELKRLGCNVDNVHYAVEYVPETFWLKNVYTDAPFPEY